MPRQCKQQHIHAHVIVMLNVEPGMNARTIDVLNVKRVHVNHPAAGAVQTVMVYSPEHIKHAHVPVHHVQ